VTIGAAMRAAARRGADALTQAARGNIAAFARSCRAPGGGFRGRSPEPDLYYSLFGLECLAVLDGGAGASGDQAFCQRFGAGDGLDLVHLASLVRCRALLAGGSLPETEARALAVQVACFRAEDGGYRLARGAGESAVYAAFLAAAALGDLGADVPDADAVARAVERRAAPDGGYAGGTAAKAGTTTVTAAAVVLLRQLNQTVRPETVRWLKAQHAGGGFRAAPGAPVPDLLSTASALFALAAAGEPLADLRGAGRTFVESLWQDDGGFAGSAADPVADVEYTFYALLALGALAP
jgi:prenyltransferase beta subunit